MSSTQTSPPQSPKFEIGYAVRRPNQCSLRICGYTHDGRYLAHPVLRAIPEANLLQHFPETMLQPGAALRTPADKIILLVGRRETGYWDVTHHGDVVELTEAEIEDYQADVKACADYPDVATRRWHPETNPGRTRYLPRKATGTA